jgi:hypothetical protein
MMAILSGASKGAYVMVAGKMIYVDSTLAIFFISLYSVFVLLFNCLQTSLIKSVQTCIKLKMNLLTPLLPLKITPMVAAIFGKYEIQ